MAMTNSFAAVQSNRFTRKWAGSNGGTVDPHLTGYFFTHWSFLPPMLGAAIAATGGPDTISANSEAAAVLHASCLSVTLPGGTVNKTEFSGLGGVKWSAPTNVEFDNTITLRLLEFQSIPVFAILHGWVRLIRDSRTGVSHFLTGDNYSKSSYTGVLYYFSTRPDGLTVEQSTCASGLYPMKDPTDLYGGDLATIDKLEVDIDFSLDYLWQEPWVKTRCDAIATMIAGDKDKIDLNYGQGEPAL